MSLKENVVGVGDVVVEVVEVEKRDRRELWRRERVWESVAVVVVRGRMRDNRRARDLIGLSGEWRCIYILGIREF